MRAVTRGLRGVIIAVALLLAVAAAFAGGWIVRAAAARQAYGGWFPGPHGFLPGFRTIGTNLGAYHVFVSLSRPLGPARRRALEARTHQSPSRRMAEEVEGVTHPCGGELSVTVAAPDVRGGMLSLEFFPRGWLGVPETRLSAGLPAGGPGATRFWTILGMSGGLATRVGGDMRGPVLYYRIGGRWAPAKEVRMAGRPKGTTLIWRGKRYEFDPRVGYWLASKDGLSQRGRSRGNK